MSRDDFFDVVGDVYSPYVYCPVLTHEAPYTAHVISVIAVFVSSEDIYIRVEHIVYTWESMEVFALLALGADPARKEQTEVRAGYFICFCVAAVFGNIATSCGGCLGEVLVFAVATGPFVVPDVEDGTGLRRRFGFHC